MPKIIVAKNPQHLRRLVRDTIRRKGPHCDLNHIDVSKIDYFDELFKDTQFNGNVSRWNMQSATVLSGMFMNTPFNGDISQWNTSNVVHMHNMFAGTTAFQGNISGWDVSNVSTMGRMFQGSVFQGDLSRWRVANVRTMNNMFEDSGFRGEISQWDTASLRNAERMFVGTAFNGDVSTWNTSKLENAKEMFHTPSFTRDLSSWVLASDAFFGNLVHGTYRQALPQLTNTRNAYANYQHMVGSQHFNAYLQEAPFSHVHATFLVESLAQSWWADAATQAWAQEHVALAKGMGLTEKETIELVQARYSQREIESVIEFSNPIVLSDILE